MVGTKRMKARVAMRKGVQDLTQICNVDLPNRQFFKLKGVLASANMQLQ